MTTCHPHEDGKTYCERRRRDDAHALLRLPDTKPYDGPGASSGRSRPRIPKELSQIKKYQDCQWLLNPDKDLLARR